MSLNRTTALNAADTLGRYAPNWTLQWRSRVDPVGLAIRQTLPVASQAGNDLAGI
jgi:hypothetical protein